MSPERDEFMFVSPKTVEGLNEVIKSCKDLQKKLKKKPEYTVGKQYGTYRLVQMCVSNLHTVNGYGLMSDDYRIYDFAPTIKELCNHNPISMAI